MLTKRPIEERFWEKVNRRGPDECWPWTAARAPNGYGHLFVRKRPNRNPLSIVAHRFSYELHIGPIPEGLFVCHACDNRACVNPAHLWVGTNRDNLDDMLAKGRSVSSGPRGTAVHTAKLTEDDVRAIRARRASGEILRTIAADYGIGFTNVYKIAAREIWKDVE